ncbi:abscission/NoCut checkpoint regulator-like [Dysidea avara]|uniref:abscission/NoCut checkpoint regulator-like n=1 Tax=Dysidea avara TaxID=196820 RepID=UPI00332FCDED
MSNQCYGCAAHFKRFHKPEDCMKCHRMFCSECLQYPPSDIAKKSTSKICFNCSRADRNILKKQQEAETLENLEKKYKKVASEQSVKSAQRARFREDENLERRLKELKGAPKTSTVPSVQALQQRLDKLKAAEDDLKASKDKATGQDKPQDPASNKGASPLPTRKTAEEETRGLMKQTADEVNIEQTQDAELGQRLYNLKTGGQPPPSGYAQAPANTNVSADQPPSGENNDGEVQNLIKHAMEENKLEEQHSQETDAFIANCEARLQKLTDDAKTATKYSEEVRSKLHTEDSSNSYSLDLSEEYLDKEVQKLVEQFAAEVELDKKDEQYFGDVGYGQTDTPEIPKPRPTDELPWCCICNDDATLRCCDCDDDLYCERCFHEGHQQFQLFNHIYVTFTKPGQTATGASNK